MTSSMILIGFLEDIHIGKLKMSSNIHYTRRLVLNLYAGIGGNRKHWENVEVTAIEYNEEIANVYKQLHPNNNVIVTDAHDYLWRLHFPLRKNINIVGSSPTVGSKKNLSFEYEERFFFIYTI